MARNVPDFRAVPKQHAAVVVFPNMASEAVAALWNVERDFVPAAGMRESESEIKEEILFVAHFDILQLCLQLYS